MVAVTDPNQQLYVMQPSMSSPFFVSKSETYESENAKKMYYKFTSDDRKKIQAVRQAVNVMVDAGCARFYGLKIANETTKQQLIEALEDADRKMKSISPELHAEAQFLPLKTEAFTSGTLLDNLTAQIREQIHGVVLKRIEAKITEENNGVLSEKSKLALLKMLEKCRAVNVIGDDGINKRIEDMKQKITDNQIVVLRDEILALLDDTRDRFSSIDMFNIPAGGNEEPRPLTDDDQAAIDEEKRYDARPALPGEDFEEDPEPAPKVKPEDDERKKRAAARFDVM